MLSKESKFRVLEGFYGLDYTIFGKPVNKVETCCPILKEEYLSIKGALLSVYIEMLKLVEYSPEVIEEKMDSSKMLKKAKSSARVARENAQKIVVSEKSRDAIKTSLKEDLENSKDIDLSKLVESKIREKAFSLAVDNLLLIPVLNESKSYQKLNDWEGRIIEDSYKILRDNLVEGAIQMIYEDDDMFTEEEKIDEMYDTDKGDVASGKAMVNAKGAGTEQAGTGDAKTIQGAKKEAEKEIAKEAA